MTKSVELQMPTEAVRERVLRIVDEAIKDYADRGAPRFTLIQNIASYLNDEDCWLPEGEFPA